MPIDRELDQLAEEDKKSANRQRKLQLLAHDFCNSKNIAQNLCYISDYQKFCWYEADSGYWRILQKYEQSDFFYHKIDNNWLINVTRNLLKDFVFNVSFNCIIKRDNYYSEYIALEDCLLNTGTFETCDFDKNKWAFYKLHIKKEQLNNLDSPLPDDSRFKQFINEILIGRDEQTDPSLVMLVQEMFGYCLTDSIKSEATFFLKGDRGSNGKGCLVELLQEMIGQDFHQAINLKALSSDKFAFGSLVGKKLNISEENEGDSIDSAILKTLVSGDQVRIENKFEDSFNGKLQIKYIFTTNQMPKFTNFDNALKRRLHIVPFDRHFTEEERDFDLREKLKKEIDNVTLWSLQGLKRLIANKFHFTKSELSQSLLEEEQEDNNTCMQFLRETYQNDTVSGGIPIMDFYNEYVHWCEVSRRKPVSKQRVGKDLNKLVNLKAFSKWNASNKKMEKHYPLKIRVDEEPPIEF
jgi:P4 family phage/plasmid primase-like protien